MRFLPNPPQLTHTTLMSHRSPSLSLTHTHASSSHLKIYVLLGCKNIALFSEVQSMLIELSRKFFKLFVFREATGSLDKPLFFRQTFSYPDSLTRPYISLPNLSSFISFFIFICCDLSNKLWTWQLAYLGAVIKKVKLSILWGEPSWAASTIYWLINGRIKALLYLNSFQAWL